MFDLLVLGLIPGTNISISFQGWLVICGMAITSYVIIRYQLHQRSMQRKLASIQHMRVHASQLHQRAV